MYIYVCVYIYIYIYIYRLRLAEKLAGRPYRGLATPCPPPHYTPLIGRGGGGTERPRQLQPPDCFQGGPNKPVPCRSTIHFVLKQAYAPHS